MGNWGGGRSCHHSMGCRLVADNGTVFSMENSCEYIE